MTTYFSSLLMQIPDYIIIGFLMQIFGYLVVGIYAWLINKQKYAIIFSIVLMLIVNFVTYALIPRKVSGVVSGAIGLPLQGAIVAWICFKLSEKRKRRHKKDDNGEDTNT